MKKIISPLIIICLLVLCAFAMISCNENLSTPSGLYLDIETVTLKWNAVKGAKYYTIDISGEERSITTKNNYVSLEKLEAGDYEITIRANSDGKSMDDSEVVKYNFTREAESGLSYKLINNKTEYALVGGGTAEGEVVMESVYRGKPVTTIDKKALYGNIKITKLTIGENVKTIGSKAFSKCPNLEAVVIPEGVTTIEEYAFQSCKLLTTITLPDTLKEIAPHTFAWCEALTEVTVGKNLTAIGNYAFASCEALVSVKYNTAPESEFKISFPDTLKSVGSYAFSDCTLLPDINLGNGVETIDSYAFINCTSLAKIDLGESLLSIDEYAFNNCEALLAVSIPDSTVTIDNGVFYGCRALNDVSLGKGLKSIGYYVFNLTKLIETEEKLLIVDGWLIKIMDSSLEKLTLRNQVRGVASYAGLNCSKLAQIDISGVEYVCAYAFPFCTSLYKMTFDDALVEIGAQAFYGCDYLREVKLGNNLKTIGDYAFFGCMSLREVDIPDSVTTVGTRAFRNTQAYNVINNSTQGTVYMDDWAVDYIPPAMSFAATIKVKDGIKGIAKYTYSGNELNSVTLPDSIQYLCKGAFYKCSPKFLNLPTSIKYIGDYAFYNCLTTNFSGTADFLLDIPAGTEYIGNSAFLNCKYILNVNVPGSVKTIGKYAFYGCTNIGASVEVNVNTGYVDEKDQPIYETVMVTGSITLGEGVEFLGDRVFQNCTGIKSITIPNSVKYLGEKAFYKCEALTEVELGNGITTINAYTFYKCLLLEKVVISDNLEVVGDYAFRGCTALKEFDLKNIRSIGRYAFYTCEALTELTLPDTLVSIGDYAFRGCTAVTSIVIPENVEVIGKHVFYGLNDTTIYCQASAAKPNWNYHFNSSFRPVFYGCTLSEDNKYVVSVVVVGKETLINATAKNGISDPVRKGYVFAGWTTIKDSSTGEYTSETVAQVTDGTVLYAVWTQQP